MFSWILTLGQEYLFYHLVALLVGGLVFKKKRLP
jgi:hypothetical protein